MLNNGNKVKFNEQSLALNLTLGIDFTVIRQRTYFSVLNIV